MDHHSRTWRDSKVCPGVRFQITKLSLGRRIGLARSVRTLWEKMRFHEASKTPDGELENAVLMGELECEYLRWGLVAVEGLLLDGAPATVESLIDSGPEPLAVEIASHIRAELGLSGDERKN